MRPNAFGSIFKTPFLGGTTVMDYGREVQFGYFLTPSSEDVQAVTRQARLCEDLGLDLIGIQDHPYQRRFLDTWTLLAFLAAQTKRVRLFPDVINLPLRPPAVLAKSAASLDLLSAGRIELGLGAGAMWEAIGALGGPQRAPGEAVDALEEAIQVIRLMWSGQRGLRFEGQHYRLNGAHSGPLPAHAIGLWIGAYGPRMLNLTGRLGDGWVPSSSYAPPAKLIAMQERIDEAAESAGRAPCEIRRLYNVMGKISDGPSGDFFNGPVQQWVDELTELTLDCGMDSYIFSPAEDHERQLQRFAQEVAPAVRAEVLRRRG
jgi:alkanesulfonate monooxygenase SsuD/methylene tetrahydromethanopterin reductase-like flavin-dependent oxidoreductase (luciferase family)